MVTIVGAKMQQEAIELVPLVRPSQERIFKSSLFGGVYVNAERSKTKLDDTKSRKNREDNRRHLEKRREGSSIPR